MSTYLVKPLYDVTKVSATAESYAPIEYALKDPASLAWRGTNGAGTLDLGAANRANFIAVIGTNLNTNNGYRARSGAAADGLGTTDGGIKNPTGQLGGKSSIVLHQPSDGLLDRYVKFSAHTITDLTYVQIERIVIGTAVEFKGLDRDAEITIEDMSNITQSSGFDDITEYRIRHTLKGQISQITEAKKNDELAPLIYSTGTSKTVMIVADSNTMNQTEMVFGRFSQNPQLSHPYHDSWSLKVQIRST